MKRKSILASVTAVVALTAAIFLYSAHSVRGSDHQQTPATVARPAADITDVYVFPSPTNPANVVFVMDVFPLIPAGMGPTKFFDPSVMYQFKILHAGNGSLANEDMVIQVGATGADQNQTLTVYGPGAPATTGTINSFITASGSFKYNAPQGSQLPNGILAFAGPRSDPFFFDLFQFFKILPDRNYQNPRTDNTLGSPTPTFNGFPAGTTSGAASGNYACSNTAAVNALTDIGGGFNLLAIVLEVPKSLIAPNPASQLIHVWATTNTVSGS